MIKELRKIDPNWKATQVGFCYWSYDLIDQKGSKWHLQQCAKFCPRFDGDDDNFKITWYLYINSEPPKKYYPCTDKFWAIEQTKEIYNEKFRNMSVIERANYYRYLSDILIKEIPEAEHAISYDPDIVLSIRGDGFTYSINVPLVLAKTIERLSLKRSKNED